MTRNLTITKYDSEFTSWHYLKPLQWFQESDFGKNWRYSINYVLTVAMSEI